jgi:hypothetical protein
MDIKTLTVILDCLRSTVNETHAASVADALETLANHIDDALDKENAKTRRLQEALRKPPKQ